MTTPESAQLGLLVERLAVPAMTGGRSDGYRLRVPVAGTVLLPDLAVWQRGPVLGLSRLTHRQEAREPRGA